MHALEIALLLLARPVFKKKIININVKKIKYGKYRQLITMLMLLSINVPFIEALGQMLGYAKIIKDMMTKKRYVSFEDDEGIQHCSAIDSRFLFAKVGGSRCLHHFMYYRVASHHEGAL